MSEFKVPLLLLAFCASLGALFSLSIWTGHLGVHWTVPWAIFMSGGVGFSTLLEVRRELRREV